MNKWEFEKHELAPSRRSHAATDSSLLGIAGKWGACGWSVEQLDYDEELALLQEIYGSMEAEFEVQRTLQRAGLTAFFCLLKMVIGPIKVHDDNKGIVDGLWRGERTCIIQTCGSNLGKIASTEVKRNIGGGRA